VFVREGDSVVVVGSNFGRARHPAWTGNLIAQPRAVVKAGGHDVPVLATLLAGDEAETAFEKIVGLSRVYLAIEAAPIENCGCSCSPPRSEAGSSAHFGQAIRCHRSARLPSFQAASWG
jgi:deazaflavin-dependent oxidoreductase (nitroreductase family)